MGGALLLQRARLDSVLVRRPALFRLREEFDEVVDAQDGNGRFGGEFQTLGFDHRGLVHTRLLVIPRLSVHQVQADPARTHTHVHNDILLSSKMLARFCNC